MGQIKAKSAGDAHAAASKRPEVKRFVGKQETGDLVLKICAADSADAARQVMGGL